MAIDDRRLHNVSVLDSSFPGTFLNSLVQGRIVHSFPLERYEVPRLSRLLFMRAVNLGYVGYARQVWYPCFMLQIDLPFKYTEFRFCQLRQVLKPCRKLSVT